MSRRHTLTLWLAGAALALTACGGEDPEPKFATDPTPTPVVSATPVVEKETPEEFIRRWNEIDRVMQNTGDTAEYRQVSKDCVTCLKTADLVESYYAAGGYIEWRGREISRIKHVGGDAYDVWFTITPTKVRKDSEAPQETILGGEGKMRFVLNEEPDGLRMADLTLRPVS